MRQMLTLLFLILATAGCATTTPPAVIDPAPTSPPAPAVAPPLVAPASPTAEPGGGLSAQQPTPFAPPTTVGEAVEQFADPVLGISFSYPSDWQILARPADAPAGVTLHAPPVGAGPEPIIFAITVDVSPATESSVKEVVDQQLAQVPPDLSLSIKRRTRTIGGEAAEEITGLPSQAGAIEAFILHGRELQLIVLQPYDEGNSSLIPYLPPVRSAFEQVLATYKFLK